MLRYKKDHNVDGWPIVDTGSGEILDTADIVNKLNQYESILADWISVEDRLPNSELGEWVLVCAGGAINCMGYINHTFDHWIYSPNHNIAIDDVTHWMPLPEPPTKQGE
tara:strand:+ start:588 stop:914 length:327 start_codon:yes stop_codon:yes gene_type:complete